MKYDFDVDIDVADRTELVGLVRNTPASICKDGKFTKHNTGIYLQSIPFFPVEGYSSIDHKQAEQEGWFKLDILNNSIYKDVKSEAHLIKLLNTEPMWELLQHTEVVEKLYHINNYADVLKQYKPTSIEHFCWRPC